MLDETQDDIEYAPLSEHEMTFDEAVLYCTFCRHNNHTDWRIPTWEEFLASINSDWIKYSWNSASSDVSKRVRKSRVLPVRSKQLDDMV